MKVLVIQQRMGIGDMIIFLPYIHAISKKFQDHIGKFLSKIGSQNQRVFTHNFQKIHFEIFF